MKLRPNAPTLATIADITGYSKIAVSMALRDSDEISEETKEEVRAAAKRIGYQPNIAARALRNSHASKVVIFILAEEFPNLLTWLTKFTRAGYISVCVTEEAYSRQFPQQIGAQAVLQFPKVKPVTGISAFCVNSKTKPETILAQL